MGEEAFAHAAQGEARILFHPLKHGLAERDLLVRRAAWGQLVEGGRVPRLPCFHKRLLVARELAIKQQVFACPSRALFGRAVIVADRVFDAYRSDFDPTKLLYKGAAVQFGDDRKRRVTGFEIDRQGIALELFAEFVDALIDRENRDRTWAGCAQRLDYRAKPPAPSRSTKCSTCPRPAAWYSSRTISSCMSIMFGEPSRIVTARSRLIRTSFGSDV
jgi:hypothetical protein